VYPKTCAESSNASAANVQKLVVPVPVAVGLISKMSISVDVSETSERGLRPRSEPALGPESEEEESDCPPRRLSEEAFVALCELGLAKLCDGADVESPDARDLRLELLDPPLAER
jgi:hypothetical protein